MLISSMPRESGVIRRSTRVSDGCDDAASAVIPLAVLLRSCAQCALRVEAAAVAVLQALRVVQSLLCEHQEHRNRSPHARGEVRWPHVVSSVRPELSAGNGVATWRAGAQPGLLRGGVWFETFGGFSKAVVRLLGRAADQVHNTPHALALAAPRRSLVVDSHLDYSAVPAHLDRAAHRLRMGDPGGAHARARQRRRPRRRRVSGHRLSDSLVTLQ